MILRLALIAACSAIPAVLLASDNSLALLPFPDAGKSLQQLARESVNREIAASVEGKRTNDLTAPLTLRNLPVARLQQHAPREACSIPLLDSKVQHPERFSMSIIKLPATRADHMAVSPPAPSCQGWH